MASTSRQMPVPHKVSLSGPSSAAHDVFLSFAGMDTRKMIVDPLCTALNAEGIRTYFKERDQQGEEMSSKLIIPAIDMSKIIIVVLSKSYAFSTRCLDVLVQILESKSTGKQHLLPIFYDVLSADVSEQTGEFGTAFQEHTAVRKHEKWKSALHEIGCLPGFHFSTSQPGFDWEFKEIVEEVKLQISQFDDKADKMGVHPDFPFSAYSLSNIEEFLRVLKNHGEYKDGNVAVRKLNTMDIGHLQLSEIPDNLSFPDLEKLVLHPNLNLNCIPSSFFERMPALKTLHMSSMYITNLMELGAPKSLKRLNLNCTNLIEISECFEFPHDLTTIDLKDCKSLIKLPESISKLKSLQNLYLSGCTSLAEIPESIGSAQCLTTLDLTDCKNLAKLPDGLSKLGSLQDLNISGCRTLESFECPQGLTTLDLSNCTSLTKLPESINKLRFLKNLYLSGCSSLYEINKPGASIPRSWTSSDANRCIPSSFFKRMPGVEVLDISHTSIKTLPSWVCNLTKLKQLILQHCELPIKLPDRIDNLKNLVFLDLDGTDLVCLPKKLRKLTKLKRLNVSFYDSDCSRKSEELVDVILPKILLKLPQLEELSISFDPQNLWCSDAVEAIIKDLPTLTNLNTLKLYLPKTELLKNFMELTRIDEASVFKNLTNFNLIIGPHTQRFIPRLPCDLEEEFLKLNKCVKYIGGEGATTEFAQALMHANALYLDCHWSLQKLSVFKLEELLQLKFCLLVDCNEMQTVFDGNDFPLTAPYTPVSLLPLDCNEIQTVFDEREFNPGVPNTGDNLLSLQYLAIHYLQKLQVIWRGPGVGCGSQSLKVLVLHMCPNLTTIFTPALPNDLPYLEEIIVEDCPKIETLIEVADSSQLTSKYIFPQLKRLSLVDLPKLVSITNGKSIGPKLKNVVIYGCAELKSLPALGAENKEGIKIKGEHKWWTALGKDAPKCMFSELDTDEDFKDVLAAKYKNSLRLCKQPSELETYGDCPDELTRMEVHLDFPETDYNLYNNEEFLGVLMNHGKYKDVNVAVRKLKTMSIIRNGELSKIPENLSFPDLEGLGLHGNQELDCIPSSFFDRMPSLKELKMSSMPLESLPPRVFKLIKLEKLSLNFCVSLLKLPHEISALGSLTSLDLTGCSHLVEIPESIEFPQCLSSLDLQFCRRLKRLPESLSKLKFLKKIKLSGCSSLDEFNFEGLSITKLSWDRQADKTEAHIGSGYLPRRLYNLDRLPEFLGLMKKVMTSNLLQTEFVAVKDIRRMNLTNPIVSELPDNLSFPDLEDLFLRTGDYTKDLGYIPSSFFKRTPCLKTLHMSSANITNLGELLHEISALKRITRLEINFCTNLIKFPESFEFPQGLIELDLTDCTSLTKIPESISKLKSLQRIDLSGCKSLSEIPESFEFPQDLIKLDLTDCTSLTKLPKSFRNKKARRIISLSGCSSLFKFNLPEVSIRSLSTFYDASTMEVHLDFPETDYTVDNIEEFLGVLMNHGKYKDVNVAVRKLKTMNIKRNGELSKIPENLSFPDLEGLGLHGNQELDCIPSSFFDRMPSLKELKMSSMPLESLPPWVFKLIKLEKLSLNFWESLMKLPHEISALGSLTALVLAGCSNLVEIPESIEFPQCLSSLDLQFCKRLKRLPESLSKLKYLKKIKLSGCSSLDEFKFGGLSISKLSWDRQADKTEADISPGLYTLDSLPEFLGLMKKVMTSNLLQTEFVAVKDIRRMNLTNPIVSELPDNLSFPDLEDLFLRTGDYTKDLGYIPSSFFKGMPCLKTLHMSSANITNLGELLHEISALKRITRLELNFCTNLIKFPESFEFPQDLITLDLRNCTSLTKIPESISKLKSLQRIYLSGCTSLSEIPESFEFPQNLIELDLRDCTSLTKLAKSFSNKKALRFINLSGCSSLFEFNSPEVSIRSLSTFYDASTMEILLEWHKTKGTLPDITGLLGLVEKVRENKLLNWKFAEVPELKEIHIKNSKFPTIPDNVNFPDLKKLVLQPNFDISCIPSSFFERMPDLEVLDMSHTRMKTLPSWVCNWTKLKELILQCCELPINLPDTLIDKLKNLVGLDLDGTHLVCLPEKLSELTKLKRLKISFFDAESYSKSEETVAVILPKILLKLSQLEELSISFDPQDVWCSAAVKAIMEHLPKLKYLQTLKLYLPTTELLQNFIELERIDNQFSLCKNLRDFNLIFGPPAQRFISRLPYDFEEEFLKFKKYVKYINGKDETTKFAELLRHTNALYLDCHWSIQKLSVFKLEELKELNFCLLVDCNEMQTVFDESDFNLVVPNTGDNLLPLQYLAIHYLKNLEVIWKGPGVGRCLKSLKVLVLHMCPNLTTIFTAALPNDLPYLEEIIVEECPKIQTLIVVADSSKNIFRRLKKLSLVNLPELVKITEGESIGPNLENVVIYGCPKLKRLPALGAMNKVGIKIKVERKWWTALEQDAPKCMFSEDIQDALAAKYKNSLRLWKQPL